MTNRNLVKAIYTANAWSSDKAGDGLACLQLGTTRKVHSYDHQTSLVKEIRDNIEYLIHRNGTKPLDAEERRDVNALLHLWEAVMTQPVGAEWITDSYYHIHSELLYRQGII